MFFCLFAKDLLPEFVEFLMMIECLRKIPLSFINLRECEMRFEEMFIVSNLFSDAKSMRRGFLNRLRSLSPHSEQFS